MSEGASNSRRGGGATETDGPARGVSRGGGSARAETLLRRFGAIAESAVRNRLIVIMG